MDREVLCYQGFLGFLEYQSFHVIREVQKGPVDLLPLVGLVIHYFLGYLMPPEGLKIL